MRERRVGETGQTTRWVRRIASCLPIVALFALLAAIRSDAADGLINTLIVVAFAALVLDVVIFARALIQDS